MSSFVYLAGLKFQNQSRHWIIWEVNSVKVLLIKLTFFSCNPGDSRKQIGLLKNLLHGFINRSPSHAGGAIDVYTGTPPEITQDISKCIPFLFKEKHLPSTFVFLWKFF